MNGDAGARRRLILVVDDEPAIARAYARALVQAGYDALIAPTGAEAVGQITAREPDLVILDLILPDMHGLDVLRTIREPDKRVRMPVVITLSNFQDADLMEAAFKLGAIAAVPKDTLKLKDLAGRVAGWLQVNPI